MSSRDPSDPDEPTGGGDEPTRVRPSELAACGDVRHGGDPEAPEQIDGAPSGSIDVEFSAPHLPAATDAGGEATPGGSGSIDVQLSGADLPRAQAQPPRRKRSTTLPAMIAESLTRLPVVKEVMPRTRRARVMLRSVVVAFAMISSWIVAIVWLQTRAEEKPDFRPQIEGIFVQLRDDADGAHEVWLESSERFQEMVHEDAFVDQISDMQRSLGPFVEVTNVVNTETFRGPSGRTGRADVLLAFANGTARGTMSFRWEDRRWKMLGLTVEVPDKLIPMLTTDAAKKQRVALPPEIRSLVEQILVQTREGQDDTIWNAAAPVFQQSISRVDFHELQEQRRATLGPYRRILTKEKDQVGKQNPSHTGASLDLLLEFGNDQTIAGSFRFSKIDGAWRLSFYKLITPMPHSAGE
ncbi:MAG: hypothetical protein KC464_22030 [Myxococcales bacterium]|nr:hypothetical protein [Myxococcales bacterium]